MATKPTPPGGTQTLGWAMSKLGCTYTIVRVNQTYPSPLYELRLSTPIYYGNQVMTKSARFSTAWGCESYVCTELGWYWYNPGVWLGKVCVTYPGFFGVSPKRVDLTCGRK